MGWPVITTDLMLPACTYVYDTVTISKQTTNQAKNWIQYFLDPIAMVRDLHEEIRHSIIKTISSLD